MVPEVEAKLKLKNSVLQTMLKSMNLEHFIPKFDTKTVVKNNTMRRSLLSNMIAYNNNKKYGNDLIAVRPHS
jgi:hypothetical protein